MNWIVIAQLVAQYGIPVAEAIFQKVQSGQEPTQADFDQLKAMAQQTAQDRMRAQLVAAGVDLESDLAKQLLAQTVPPTPGAAPTPTIVPDAPSPGTPPESAPPSADAPVV